MFFYCDEYWQTINQNGLLGQAAGLPSINADYDIKACIQNIMLFDVLYLPLSNEVFTKDYASETNLISSNNNSSFRIPIYDPRNLGKHKTEHWEYEQETRLMCITNMQDFSGCDYIDLRLQESFFQEMQIIMSPWAENGLYDEIIEIVNKSLLAKAIRDTIKVVPSELHGQVL